MKKTYLIADSGATKCHWTLVQNGKKQTIKTTGISPYFLGQEAIVQLLEKTFQKKNDIKRLFISRLIIFIFIYSFLPLYFFKMFIKHYNFAKKSMAV